MAAKSTDTRRRMLDSTADLLGRNGTAGTTVDAVLAHSGAPRGSVYHHFPDGRRQLVVEAVRASGARVDSVIDAAVTDGDPELVLRQLVTFWRTMLVASDYRAGCPVVAVAVGGADQVPGAADAVAQVFADWRARLVTLLAPGRPPAQARRLANLLVAAVEGALVLSRAERSTRPLDDVVAELTPLLKDP